MPITIRDVAKKLNLSITQVSRALGGYSVGFKVGVWMEWCSTVCAFTIGAWTIWPKITCRLPPSGIPESIHNFPGIKVDERGGFKRLVLHLTDKGHRRIAFIGGPKELVIQQERFGGYRQGMAAANMEYDDHLVALADLTEDGGYLAAGALLGQADPPTAILGCNDQIAIGVIRAVKEQDVRSARNSLSRVMMESAILPSRTRL